VNGDLPIERLRALTVNSGVPRYRQIAEQIATLIEDAEPGVRLPSEHDLARYFPFFHSKGTGQCASIRQASMKQSAGGQAGSGQPGQARHSPRCCCSAGA